MFFHTVWLVLNAWITLWRSAGSLVITTCLYTNKRKNHRPGWHSRNLLTCSGISQIRIPASTPNKVTKIFRDFSESLRIDSGVVSRNGTAGSCHILSNLLFTIMLPLTLCYLICVIYVYIYIYKCVCEIKIKWYQQIIVIEEKKIQSQKVMPVNHQQSVILPFTVYTNTQSIFNLYNMIQISVHIHGRLLQN